MIRRTLEELGVNEGNLLTLKRSKNTEIELPVDPSYVPSYQWADAVDAAAILGVTEQRLVDVTQHRWFTTEGEGDAKTWRSDTLFAHNHRLEIMGLLDLELERFGESVPRP